MVQHSLEIAPLDDDGLVLTDKLHRFKEALLSLHQGASRPPYAQGGTLWIKIFSSSYSALMLFDGQQDILLQGLDTQDHKKEGALITETEEAHLKISDGVIEALVTNCNWNLAQGGYLSFGRGQRFNELAYDLETQTYVLRAESDTSFNAGGRDPGKAKLSCESLVANNSIFAWGTLTDKGAVEQGYNVRAVRKVSEGKFQISFPLCDLTPTVLVSTEVENHIVTPTRVYRNSSYITVTELKNNSVKPHSAPFSFIVLAKIHKEA